MSTWRLEIPRGAIWIATLGHLHAMLRCRAPRGAAGRRPRRRRGSAARSASDSGLSPLAPEVSEAVQALLSRTPPPVGLLWGAGCALGLSSTWSLRSAGLSWVETVVLRVSDGGDDVILRTSFDASTGVCWQSDLNGRVQRLLPTDDAFDRALLTTWCRSGHWILAAQEDALVVEVAAADGDGSVVTLRLRLPGSKLSATLLLRAYGALLLPYRLALTTGSSGEETWEWSADPPELAGWPHIALHTTPAGQTSSFTASQQQASPAPPAAGWLQPPTPAPPPAFAAAEVPCARAAGGHFLIRSAARGWLTVDPCCDGSALAPSTSASAGASRLAPSAAALLPGLGGAALAAPLVRGGLEVGPLSLPPRTVHLEMALDGLFRTAGTTASASSVGGLFGASLLEQCVLELRCPAREPGGRDAPPVTAILHPRPVEAGGGGGGEPFGDRVAASWQSLTLVDGAPHLDASLRLHGDAAGGPPPAPAPLRLRLALGVGGVGVLLCRRAAMALNLVGPSPSSAAEDAGAAFARPFALGASFAAPHALAPSGHAAAPGAARARTEPLAGGDVLSLRAAALELRGATFEHGAPHTQMILSHASLTRTFFGRTRTPNQPISPLHAVRVLAHAEADPPDLALSSRCDGLLGAELLRGATLWLDLAGRRAAVVQHPKRASRGWAA